MSKFAPFIERQSYWQIGCDDAKAGKPARFEYRHHGGYKEGYHWGQHGRHQPAYTPYVYLLSSPYMPMIERVEEVLDNLQLFTKQNISMLDRARAEEYIGDMLEVRDTLHRFRQAEIQRVGQD